MQFSITKSGLEIFDTCRAWGLANLLYAACDGNYSPLVRDAGSAFAITSEIDTRAINLKRSPIWRALKSDDNWQKVFLTYKNKWAGQRDNAMAVLEQNIRGVVDAACTAPLQANLNGDTTLPGPLDPISFKGLRGVTLGDYREEQTYVDEVNWALACLGAMSVQKYKPQSVGRGKWEHYVTLPVPEDVLLDDFHAIRDLIGNRASLNYVGVRVAAAHYAVLLADAVRERAQARPGLHARFSKLHYFSMFRSGQQVKPAAGGAVSLAPLIALALERPSAAYEMFLTWSYLFRRGSVKGNEDLALAVAEMILSPSVNNYWEHARRFNRYVVDSSKRVDPQFLYSNDALIEVMKYVEHATGSS